jgi:hypothetical protein
MNIKYLNYQLRSHRTIEISTILNDPKPYGILTIILNSSIGMFWKMSMTPSLETGGNLDTSLQFRDTRISKSLLKLVYTYAYIKKHN